MLGATVNSTYALVIVRSMMCVSNRNMRSIERTPDYRYPFIIIWLMHCQTQHFVDQQLRKNERKTQKMLNFAEHSHFTCYICGKNKSLISRKYSAYIFLHLSNPKVLIVTIASACVELIIVQCVDNADTSNKIQSSMLSFKCMHLECFPHFCLSGIMCFVCHLGCK